MTNSGREPAKAGSEKAALRAFRKSGWTSVLGSISEGISVHTLDGEIVWVNKRLSEIYHKSFSELVGLNCEQVFHGEGVTCGHKQVLGGTAPVRFEGEAPLASGGVLLVVIESLLDEHGGITGFTRVVRDITKERETYEQLLNAERFATLGQIVFGLAHNIGTPLNIISGYAEFLQMRAKPEDRSHKELSAILEQTRRIAAVFGEALDLARPPRGRSEAIDLKTLLTDSLDLVGHYLRRGDVKAGLTCRTSLPLIYGEAAQLRQAVFNLLLNAGEQVGNGGKLEIALDESPDAPDFLRLEIWGTEMDGRGHDFSHSLAGFLAKGSCTAAIGLSLAKDILRRGGAEIATLTGGSRGVALAVYLPKNLKGARDRGTSLG